MKIKIKSRWDAGVLFSIETVSIKLAVEAAVKSRANLEGANLAGANLARAYLEGAYLEGAYLVGAYLAGANLEGAYLEGAYLVGANLAGANLAGAYLEGAYLEGAYLEGAYLEGANLAGAYLEGANLEGAKNYAMSHDIAIEVVRRQDTAFFTDAEWGIIGKIAVRRPCWGEIKKTFGDSIISVLKKLADLGFEEYLKKYSEDL